MIRLASNECIIVHLEQVYLLTQLVFAKVTSDGRVKLGATYNDVYDSPGLRIAVYHWDRHKGRYRFSIEGAWGSTRGVVRA